MEGVASPSHDPGQPASLTPSNRMVELYEASVDFTAGAIGTIRSRLEIEFSTKKDQKIVKESRSSNMITGPSGRTVLIRMMLPWLNKRYIIIY